MKKDSKKGINIKQLLIVCLILVFVVGSVVINYSVRISGEIQKKQYDSIESKVASFAGKYDSSLRISLEFTNKLADILGIAENPYAAGNFEIIREIGELEQITDIFIADKDGDAIHADGTKDNVAEGYFVNIAELEKGIIANTKYNEQAEENTALFLSPINHKDKNIGYLGIEFSSAYFMIGIDTAVYAGDTNSMLLDSKGTIVETINVPKGKECIGVSINSYLERVEFNSDFAFTKTKNEIIGRKTNIVECKADGKKLYLVYAPIPQNNGYVINFFSGSYVDAMEERVSQKTVTMLIQLFLTCIAFFAVVLFINSLNRKAEDKKKEELKTLAERDALTTLYNKAATEKYIREYLETASPGKQAVLFILDIDNFKKINDTKGHAFGDEVLRTLGTTIGIEFRVTDIIGRTGGDEFCVFLKDIKDVSNVKQEGDKLVRFFKNLSLGQYVKYKVSASIGGAVFPHDANNYEALYKAADKALYKAKKRGKAQYALYSEEQESNAETSN